MSNYTERYFNNLRWMKAELQQIEDEYSDAMRTAEPYRGSAGYDHLVTQATAQRDSMVSTTRDKYGRTFREIINGMRENVQKRTTTAPTPEQLAIVQLLKLRDNVSMEELRAAARTMGCQHSFQHLKERRHTDETIHLRRISERV